MKITTKLGNIVIVDVNAKTITLPNGETRKIDGISAEHIQFTNGRCEIGAPKSNELRAALYGWIAPKNNVKADRYDAIINEGAEGFNPYRNSQSIGLNVEAGE
jgi:hypothetical protein